MRAGTVAIAAIFVIGLVVTMAAQPVRHVVAGLSMGPGLLPGDLVVGDPCAGALPRQPLQRLDRWVLRFPNGSTAVKRLVGLPGETVAITAGDLEIDGVVVVKGPDALATMGSAVEPPAPPGTARHWSRPPQTVLNDAGFAPGEPTRRLLPVRDAGFASIVQTVETATGRVRAQVGPMVVRYRLPAGGCYAVMAGRLDGRAVASAWRIPATDQNAAWPSRTCLPRGCPAHWDVALPWLDTWAPDDATASLALAIEADSSGGSATIEQVACWRDGLHLVPAMSLGHWALGDDEVFVLGDYPSGSLDCRHLGPLALSALRYRVASVTIPEPDLHTPGSFADQ